MPMEKLVLPKSEVIPTILLLRLKSCYNIIKSKIKHVICLKILKTRTLKRNFANFHKKIKLLFLGSKPSMNCRLIHPKIRDGCCTKS